MIRTYLDASKFDTHTYYPEERIADKFITKSVNHWGDKKDTKTQYEEEK